MMLGIEMTRVILIVATLFSLLTLPASSSADIFDFNQTPNEMTDCLRKQIDQKQADYIRGSVEELLPDSPVYMQTMKRISNIIAYNSSACKIPFFDLITDKAKFEIVAKPVLFDTICRYFYEIIPEDSQKECLEKGYLIQE